MKKINLKGISEILSEKELKNVMGGTNYCSGKPYCDNNHRCKAGTFCTYFGGSSGSCCI